MGKTLPGKIGGDNYRSPGEPPRHFPAADHTFPTEVKPQAVQDSDGEKNKRRHPHIRPFSHFHILIIPFPFITFSPIPQKTITKVSPLAGLGKDGLVKFQERFNTSRR